MSHSFAKRAAVFAVAPLLFAAAEARAAATWSLSAQGNQEQSTTVTEEGSDTTKSRKETLAVDYKTDLTPALSFTWKFNYDVNESMPESSFSTRDVNVKTDAGLKAAWWGLNANWSQAISTSDDPEFGGTVTTSYGADLKLEPRYQPLPDVSWKFTGDNSSLSRSYEGTFEYEFADLVQLKVQGTKTDNENRDPTSDDTENRTLSAAVSTGGEVTSTLKADLSWSYDRAQTLTLDRYDNIVGETDSMNNKGTAKFAGTPMNWITYSLEKNVEWKKDLEKNAPPERSDKWSGKITASPKFTTTLTGELGYGDDRAKLTGVDAPNKNWAQTFNSALNFTPLASTKFAASYDRSNSASFPLSTGSQSKSRSDSYKFDGETKFFDDLFSVKVSRTIALAWNNGEKTSLTRNWSITSDFGWEHIPQLSIKPSMSYTRDSDEIEARDNSSRSYKMAVGYKINLGSVTSIGLDHSYNRSTTYPAGEQSTITRQDDTKLSLALNGFLKGMSVTGDYSRSATDTSEDDLGPDLSYTHDFKYSWTLLNDYSLAFSYSHSMGNNVDANESFATSFSMSLMKGMLDVKFSHDFSHQIEGATNTQYRYLVDVSAKF